jgi:hypothetical protein
MAGGILARGVSSGEDRGPVRTGGKAPGLDALWENCWRALLRLSEESRRHRGEFAFACLRLGASPDARLDALPEAVRSHRSPSSRGRPARVASGLDPS